MAPPTTAGGVWAETVLHAFYFTPGSQYVVPNGTLVIGRGGTLYATMQGSASQSGVPNGTVIGLVPPTAQGGAWSAYVIYDFSAPGASGYPLAGVVSVGGSLFGTTLLGFPGTVFELTPPATHGGVWTESTIYIFGGPPSDGESPFASLTVGPDGVLYGTTSIGGSGTCSTSNYPLEGCGTVFLLTPPTAPGGTWTESVIYSFTGINGDGAFPAASVVVGKNGTLYGTTEYGGSAASDSACPASYYVLAGCGTVFKLTPPSALGGAWTETVLHHFTDANGDGAGPVAPLVLSSTGVLYGTATAGGAAGKGTIFAVAP